MIKIFIKGSLNELINKVSYVATLSHMSTFEISSVLYNRVLKTVPPDSFPAEIFNFKHNTARTTTYSVKFAYDKIRFIGVSLVSLLVLLPNKFLYFSFWRTWTFFWNMFIEIKLPYVNAKSIVGVREISKGSSTLVRNWTIILFDQCDSSLRPSIK